MSVYITQLIYIKEGKEEIFNQFENIAIPAIAKYNGKLLFRLKPEDTDYIERDIETPYEIHLASFPSEENFQQFMQDEERKKFLHLKEEAIQSVWLIKGEKL